MYFDKTKKRAESYIGTFGMDEQDQTELASVRRMVKNLNRDLKNMGYMYRYYVKAHGRGHRQGVYKWQNELPLKYASKVDAYIYRR
jgi:hypothetical protein|tara:strand:+ start:247 stop:504 length:258 start_codon:yes stop_codon:yes gene_type:complete